MSGGLGRIGAIRELGDPMDPRRGRGPRPMPGQTEGEQALRQVIEDVVSGYSARPNGITVSRQGVGTGWRQLPLDQRPRRERTFFVPTGTRVDPSVTPVQVAIPGLGLGNVLTGGVMPTPRVATGTATWMPENRDLLSLEQGGGIVTLRDPNLLRGSIAQEKVLPGSAMSARPVNIALAGTPDAGTAGVEALVLPVRSGDGGLPAVYQELFGDKKRGIDEPRAEYSDGTGREQFIVNTGTGLPDDTAIYARGLGYGDEVYQASNSREPDSAVPIVFHTGNRNFEIRYVDPSLVVRNEEIPVDQRKSAHESDTYREITLGGAVQEALERNKTGVILGDALDPAEKQGRFLPLRQRTQGTGSLIGYLAEPGSVRTGREAFAEDIPAENLLDGAGLWRPVYDPRIETSRLIPEGRRGAAFSPQALFRVGSPMNRDQDSLRSDLAEALSLAGMRSGRVFDAPWEWKTRNAALVKLHQLPGGIDQGFELVPVAGDGRPIGRDEVLSLANSMRGQSDHALAKGLAVVKNGSVVQRLVPQRDASGKRFTGNFYIGEEQEIGPAATLSNPVLRKAAESFARKQGLREGASLEGLAQALANGGAFAPSFVPNRPTNADPITALVTRAALTDDEIAAVPGLAQRLDQLAPQAVMADDQRLALPGFPRLQVTTAEDGAPRVAVPDMIATSGSYASDILGQSIYDMAGGSVPLGDLRARLLLQASRQRGAGPTSPEWGAGEYPTVRARNLASMEEARRIREDHADIPAAVVPDLSLIPELVRSPRPEQVFQLGLPRSNSELTMTAADLPRRLTPNPEIEALEDYMALRASRQPAQSVQRAVAADQLQLDLEPGATQLRLFPRATARYTPSPHAEGWTDYLSQLATARAAEASAARARAVRASGAQSVPPVRPASSVQLGLPLGAGVFAAPSSEVRRSAIELPVGRPSGPYARQGYYGLGEPDAYQQPMTIAGSLGGFDYRQMAENVGVGDEPGRPEQELAMAQLAKRIQARAAAQAASGAPSARATAFQPTIYRGYGT